MSKKNLVPAVEALLFAAGDGVSLSRLAASLEVSPDAALQAVETLQKQMEERGSGLAVIPLEDGFQMISREEYAPPIRNFFELRRNTPLSQAAFEVLSVIAYNQPCTRAQVEQVRGVSSDSIISRLLDRGWIEEAGNLDAPGRPALFKTSKQFLTEFGIESVKDLPPMELMSYKTIRDLEDSLRKAAGGEDKQMTIDSLLENKEENSDEAEETTDGDN